MREPIDKTGANKTEVISKNIKENSGRQRKTSNFPLP
jgi:hypothetical protein